MNVQTEIRGEMLAGAGRAIVVGPDWLARIVAGSAEKVLDRIDRRLTRGVMRVTLPNGTERVLGGKSDGFDAVLQITSYRALLRMATAGSVGCYQGWEAGEWDSPDPVVLFALFMDNAIELGDAARARGPWRLLARLTHWLHRNTRAGAERNIHAHYDLGNDFYATWLGSTMQYSSAWFGELEKPSQVQQHYSELDFAQLRKMAHVVSRLEARPDDIVLEIGCGWGHLATALGSLVKRIDAISLSDAQLEYCRSHAARFEGDHRFIKQDYRDTIGQYDGIVSIEMVEALGEQYWPDFFDCLDRCLKPGGRAVLQFILIDESLWDSYVASADFIQTYIFPGGMLIRESTFRRLAAERGLDWTDAVHFGEDYADTLELWRMNFDAAADQGRLPPGFDARFIRLWRYYLMYCEGGFRSGGIDVSQVTLVKKG